MCVFACVVLCCKRVVYCTSGGVLPGKCLCDVLMPFAVSLLAVGLEFAVDDEKDPNKRPMKILIALHQNQEDLEDTDVTALQVHGSSETAQVWGWLSCRCTGCTWTLDTDVEMDWACPQSTRSGTPWELGSGSSGVGLQRGCQGAMTSQRGQVVGGTSKPKRARGRQQQVSGRRKGAGCKMSTGLEGGVTDRQAETESLRALAGVLRTRIGEGVISLVEHYATTCTDQTQATPSNKEQQLAPKATCSSGQQLAAAQPGNTHVGAQLPGRRHGGALP